MASTWTRACPGAGCGQARRVHLQAVGLDDAGQDDLGDWVVVMRSSWFVSVQSHTCRGRKMGRRRWPGLVSLAVECRGGAMPAVSVRAHGSATSSRPAVTIR